VLSHVVERTAAAARIDRVVVATTELPEEQPIVDWCRDNGILCGRGPVEDVLARFLKIVQEYPCERVVRITADCPLIDPGCIDAVVAAHLEGKNEYTTNVSPPTLPCGLDTEVVDRDVLERVGGLATLSSHREHVTLYLRENRKHFRVGNVTFGRDRTQYRFALDRPEDYRFLQALWEQIPVAVRLPSVYEVFRILEAHPDIAALNSTLDRYEGVRRSAAREERDLNL